jgi:hypothetical protein
MGAEHYARIEEGGVDILVTNRCISIPRFALAW